MNLSKRLARTQKIRFTPAFPPLPLTNKSAKRALLEDLNCPKKLKPKPQPHKGEKSKQNNKAATDKQLEKRSEAKKLPPS
jgi:hypothetical protein